jgi:hypothetical protein
MRTHSTSPAAGTGPPAWYGRLGGALLLMGGAAVLMGIVTAEALYPAPTAPTATRSATWGPCGRTTSSGSPQRPSSTGP